MNWKALILCALLFGSAVFSARAADPITYKEIAMLLRNGEDPQFIINDTTHRKLLKPLTFEEEQDLISLGATPALINTLRTPAMIAPTGAVAAYDAHVQQQKLTTKQQQEEDQRLAAQAIANAQKQQQQAEAAKSQPNPANAGAPPPADDYTGKPVQLKFTAADGTPVDLATLHGKVVLVDFWATWCGPCMGEVPNVVAAYKKYHDKGFEIIGISLDQSKGAMLKVTAEKGMTWPQYFDGKGWKNEVSSAFHIQAIPTMWLVNKNGVIATTNARGNLEAAIEKLLAE